MGWLGGLGEGMVQYSGIMQKQKEMDWKAKEARLANDRKTNLENLRAKNTASRDETQRSFDLERDKAKWAETDKRTEADRAYKSEEKKEDRAYDIEKRKADAQAQFDILEKKTKMTQGLAQEERDRVADGYKEIAMKDGVWDAEDEVRDIAMRQGLDLKTLLGQDKPISAEMLKQVNEMLGMDEAFYEADAATKVNMVKQTYSKLTGKEMKGSSREVSWDSNDVNSMAELAKSDPNQYDTMASKFKQVLGESEYNKMMAQVNAQVQPNKKKAKPVTDEKSWMRKAGDLAVKGAQYYNYLESGKASEDWKAAGKQ